MKISINELKRLIFEEVQRASQSRWARLQESRGRNAYNPQASLGGYYDRDQEQWMPTAADLGDYDDVVAHDDEQFEDEEDLEDADPDTDPIPGEDDRRFAQLDRLTF